jgi:hypothetical protein
MAGHKSPNQLPLLLLTLYWYLALLIGNEYSGSTVFTTEPSLIDILEWVVIGSGGHVTGST